MDGVTQKQEVSKLPQLTKVKNPITGDTVDVANAQTWISGIGGVLFVLLLYMGGTRALSWISARVPALASPTSEGYQSY